VKSGPNWIAEAARWGKREKATTLRRGIDNRKTEQPEGPVSATERKGERKLSL